MEIDFLLDDGRHIMCHKDTIDEAVEEAEDLNEHTRIINGNRPPNMHHPFIRAVRIDGQIRRWTLPGGTK